jgi:16S rRNA (uracil1498-N3)-methyltransferase
LPIRCRPTKPLLRHARPLGGPTRPGKWHQLDTAAASTLQYNHTVRHRFFVEPTLLQGNTVTLSGPLAHQIAHVLRLTRGDVIILLDNSGWEHEVELTAFSRDEVTGVIRRKTLGTNEPKTRITVYQALIRPEKFAFVLQKGVEIGVVGFVPVLCDRSVIGSLKDIDAKKIERWEAIIREAAEQSGRAKLPRIGTPLLFPDAVSKVAGVSLLADPVAAETDLASLLRELAAPKRQPYQRTPPPRPYTVNLFIGPEGGFSPEERSLAAAAGLRTVHLGPRILRSETAALVAAAIILYEWGDL